MQTFMPYPSFRRSVQALDNQRLGKQRVEAYQIVKALADPNYGWQHHPAVQMWRGYREALIAYGVTCCVEWRQRGYNDSLLGRFVSEMRLCIYARPPWLGDDAFHLSHQSNLVRKDAEHYGPQFPNVPADMPYLWPPNDEYRV